MAKKRSKKMPMTPKGFGTMPPKKMPMEGKEHMMPDMPMMPKGSAAKKRAVKRMGKKR